MLAHLPPVNGLDPQSHSGITQIPFEVLERVARLELASLVWKTKVIALIRYPHCMYYLWELLSYLSTRSWDSTQTAAKTRQALNPLVRLALITKGSYFGATEILKIWWSVWICTPRFNLVNRLSQIHVRFLAYHPASVGAQDRTFFLQETCWCPRWDSNPQLCRILSSVCLPIPPQGHMINS